MSDQRKHNAHPPARQGLFVHSTAPEFPLRHLAQLAYGMSMVVGALGQVLFLGETFGGEPWAYCAAAALAAFAEVAMAASGDWSLEHRKMRRSWGGLLALGLVVSGYAASMNGMHFWTQSPSLALMFGGASMIGFLLHVMNGHILVGAYLKAEEEHVARAEADRAATAIADRERAAREDRQRELDRELTAELERERLRIRAAELAATGNARSGSAAGVRVGSRPRKPAGSPPVAGSGTNEGTGPGTAGTGLRLIAGTEPDQDGNRAHALAFIRRYRAEHGSDPTVDAVRVELGIRKDRAGELKRWAVAELDRELTPEPSSDESGTARELVGSATGTGN